MLQYVFDRVQVWRARRQKNSVDRELVGPNPADETMPTEAVGLGAGRVGKGSGDERTANKTGMKKQARARPRAGRPAKPIPSTPPRL